MRPPGRTRRHCSVREPCRRSAGRGRGHRSSPRRPPTRSGWSMSAATPTAPRSTPSGTAPTSATSVTVPSASSPLPRRARSRPRRRGRSRAARATTEAAGGAPCHPYRQPAGERRDLAPGGDPVRCQRRRGRGGGNCPERPREGDQLRCQAPLPARPQPQEGPPLQQEDQPGAEGKRAEGTDREQAGRRKFFKRKERLQQKFLRGSLVFACDGPTFDLEKSYARSVLKLDGESSSGYARRGRSRTKGGAVSARIRSERATFARGRNCAIASPILTIARSRGRSKG